jgi:lysophospholipase L1-like esterase
VIDRLPKGELGGRFQPKVVVLLIGTNDLNSGEKSAEEVAADIGRVVEIIWELCPRTKILLLGLLPRGEGPAPVRQTIATINASLATLDNGRTLMFLDFGSKFLLPGGILSKDLMPDFWHPSEKGYRLWAESISQPLHELLSR